MQRTGTPRLQRWPDDQRLRGHRPARWPRPPRSGPWRRSRDDRLAGGVAAGLAARVGIDVTVVRVVFVLAALAGLFGVAAYVLAWLLVPADGADSNIATAALGDRRGIALAAGVASLLVVVLLIASALGASWLGSLAWPLIISAAGVVLIWRNAPAGEQVTLRRIVEPVLGLTGGRGRWTVFRIVVAAVLLAGGAATLLSGRASYAMLRPLGGVALVIAALVVALGPWWLRIARDLVTERQARVRAEERADMAARIHDSVLQTLALIQRRADQPQQVIQLARAQERELRSWLFGGRAPGVLDAEVATLAGGIRLIQRDVEARHGIAVELVTVGDCALDDDLSAMLAAAREATVNAAKWSGAPAVSLFAEVEPSQVSVFVRDRGRGFDPGAVPADRKGLAESIHARMARRGGSASVRSGEGAGTEVSLRMPRTARPERQPGRP
ncbi:MAG: PspC domain-containing protein [Nocardiopsaceae bacterium]|jgi:signal transduction histidine kinase|nr:PspC domain-containing protein [Nocardiopsaceae bacterium]